MRITLLAGSLFAAVVGLAACSSPGSNQPLPTAAQTLARPANNAFHLAVVGAMPDLSCPSQYTLCLRITKHKPGKTTICVTENGSCPAPGSWTWSQQIENIKGKAVKNPVGTLTPNPGNPVDDKISEKKGLKPSHGAVKFQQFIEACSGSGSCISGTIGIITK